MHTNMPGEDTAQWGNIRRRGWFIVHIIIDNTRVINTDDKPVIDIESLALAQFSSLNKVLVQTFGI